MKAKTKKEWNLKVEGNIRKLKPVKDWLGLWIDNKDTDWESQRSAHQALRLLEMAEYEILNMQWWRNAKERKLYLKAEDNVNNK